MRPIISNDLKRLYGRIDYELLERTRFSEKTLASATTIPVLNSAGFAANDFLCLGDPEDDEQSEVVQVNSIIGNTSIQIKSPTVFDYGNKKNIYRMQYDAIKFYGDKSVVGTIAIKPDSSASIGATISNSVKYSMAFWNTTTNSETPKGEVVYDTDNMLCSVGDLSIYESLKIVGRKAIPKIDVASRDIRNMFRSQQQNIKDVDNRELLRTATAFSALHYIFLELKKTQDDVPTMKSKDYNEKYQAEINRIMSVINQEDNNVRVQSQTRLER